MRRRSAICIFILKNMRVIKATPEHIQRYPTVVKLFTLSLNTFLFHRLSRSPRVGARSPLSLLLSCNEGALAAAASLSLSFSLCANCLLLTTFTQDAFARQLSSFFSHYYDVARHGNYWLLSRLSSLYGKGNWKTLRLNLLFFIARYSFFAPSKARYTRRAIGNKACFPKRVSHVRKKKTIGGRVRKQTRCSRGRGAGRVI